MEADQLEDPSKLGTRQGDGERVRGDGIQGELVGKLQRPVGEGKGAEVGGGSGKEEGRRRRRKQIDPKQLSEQ